MRAAATKRSASVVAALALSLLMLSAAAAQQPEVINNARVVEMVAAGIGDSVLIPKIATSRIILDASEAGLVKLKSAGVSDAVIVALLERAAVNGYISSSGDINRVELPSGTEVKLVTVEKISGKKSFEGQIVNFKIAEDVKIGDRTLIAKDTAVRGVVSKARKPGMAGRGGQLSVSVDSTTAIDNQPIKLRAAKSGKGGDNFGAAFTLSYIMGIGLLIPGKNAEIKAGTVFTAYTDGTKFITAN